jgi:CRISPR-associated endonuclease/helicase Cas3
VATDTNFDDDWAHAPPEGVAGTRQAHLLDDHLREVGRLASCFATANATDLARLAGMWHDLGKRRPGFQRYIRRAGGVDAHIERVADREKTHSAAGALWAERYLSQCMGGPGRLLSRVLQYLIAGHHAGLDNWDAGTASGGLATRLAGLDAWREFEESLARPSPDDISRPDIAALRLDGLPISDERSCGTPGRFALWVRMLFSALVDADFLDTEAYMNPALPSQRAGTVDIESLLRVCEAHLDRVAAQAPNSSVNRLRAQVLRQCREKAEAAPGVFSLTVPTGGGKTLSSLAFALNHAVRHRKKRIIYAIPYTSIIEQTADVFRDVFAPLGDDVVIEHHSNVESDPERENHLSRLACENWDAPLVVTTNVQLFESLFACRTSRCRKLHSLIDSVIVLDEAQLLPVALLQPVVDVLRYLVQDFGVTVLLCTATQPVLNAQPGPDPSRGLRRGVGTVIEIIDDVPALYQALERVQVHLPVSLEVPRDWSDLADEIAGHEVVLTIVNRRADAAELYRLVSARSATPRDSGLWHLSALMCAQHRSDTIAAIKHALAVRREAIATGRPTVPIRVISTQLVEAGVDLDFPVVYRAMAGLDSIAQAAGRCNREGKLSGLGAVYVFVPPTKSPPGLLTLARDACKSVWRDRPAQPFTLPLIERYFGRLYHDAPSTDERRICELLRLRIDPKALTLASQFRDAADAFKLISDKDSATVIVHYRSPSANLDVNALIGLLEREGPSRWLMRKLQRYSVTIYRHQAQKMLNAGAIRELPSCPGLYVQTEGWDQFYDPVLGARVESASGDPAAFVA